MGSIFSRLSRFFLVARLVALSKVQRSVVSIKNSAWLSPATQPDAFKVIARRRDLYHARVFRPKSAGDRRLPLTILLHGGGFIFNNPSADDKLARYIAEKAQCVASSIDYRKAPLDPFPAAYEDTVEQTLALLGKDGDDLNIDKSKVVFCVASGGANLALSAVQDPRLHGKVLGMVNFYPPVNLAAPIEEQVAHRPDPSVRDFIAEAWNTIADVYALTSDPEKLRDPRMSPTFYKQRGDLPRRHFFIGCEHDVLCYEARKMAERLAADDQAEKEPFEGGWQAGDVRWRLMKGHVHGFDRFVIKDAAREKARLREKDAVYHEVAEWIRDTFDSAQTP